MASIVVPLSVVKGSGSMYMGSGIFVKVGDSKCVDPEIYSEVG